MPLPLILLHGALGSMELFDTLVPELASFEIHRLNFQGHGSAPCEARSFRIESFIQDLEAYLGAHNIAQANLFGYSMGGYVALVYALQNPARIQRIATLGTIFAWSPETAAREIQFLDPAKIQTKVPAFAATLRKRHTAFGWENVCRATAEMLVALGSHPLLREDEFCRIAPRVRILVGDRDLSASIEPSLTAYRNLPNAELEILPNTTHPFEQVNLTRLANSLREFYGKKSES